MSKQIKKTHKFLMHALGIMLGAVSAWFVFGKDRSDYTVVEGFNIEKYLFQSAQADTASTDSGGSDGPDNSDGAGGNGGGGDGFSDNGCFVAGTLVTLADGSTKAIEDIRAGMQVLGKDGAVYVVASLFIHDGVHAYAHDYESEPFTVVTFDNGAVLRTVGGHPIYLNGGEGWRWSSIFNLSIGTRVALVSGQASVVNIEVRPDVRGVTLYNLELMVAPGQERSYFANGILVRDTQWINVPMNPWMDSENIAKGRVAAYA